MNPDLNDARAPHVDDWAATQVTLVTAKALGLRYGLDITDDIVISALEDVSEDLVNRLHRDLASIKEVNP